MLDDLFGWLLLAEALDPDSPRGRRPSQGCLAALLIAAMLLLGCCLWSSLPNHGP